MEKDTVLVIDDSIIICNIIKNILESSELQIVMAHSGEEGILIANSIYPALILLDIIMTGIDGYETCRALKSDPKTREIPVIFITGNNDTDSVLKGFAVGAADYVPKPFIPEELEARVKVHMQNIKNQRELRALMHELKEMAVTDYLTKLYTRRYFMERLQEFVNRDDHPLSLILFDVDHFKKINDTYGHNAGDAVLVDISKIFRLIAREEDIISRWGGEEFILCLPDTNVNWAFHIAEKLRTEINKYIFQYETLFFKCSVTGGVIQYNRTISAEKNISIADQALYYGKSNGRNSCVVL